MKRPIIPPERLSEETKQLFDVLNGESDVACVVIAAAFLDAALATLLGHKLVDSEISRKLLAPTGALGSFATRADLAYALRLVGKGIYQDLIVVGEIRNRFAHSHLRLAFGEETVRKHCERLQACRVVRLDPPSPNARVEGLATRARNQFNISVAIVANQLLLKALRAKAERTV